MSGILSRGRRPANPQFKVVTLSEQFWSLADISALAVAGWLLICACTFMNLANFNTEKDKVGLDLQVLIKLGLVGCSGLYGIYGFATRRRVQQIMGSFPVLWIVLIAGFYFLAVPFSITPLNSLVSAVAILCILLLTVTALDHLGIMKVLMAVLTGMSLFIVLSWVVYFAVPSVGILVEALPEGKFAYRMSGLAHANTLGQYSGLTLMLITVLIVTYRFRSPFVFLIGLLALGALINCLSRTSVMATVLGLAFGYRHLFFKAKYLNYYLLAAIVGGLLLMIASTQMDIQSKIESKLSFLSKSGDTEELTTATGRSEIWAYTIYLLKQQPLTGYGAATSRFFLSEYSQYTHNLVLNVAFSSGIFGGLACLGMILGRLKDLFRNRHPLVDSVVVFVVVNGLFENVIFSIISGMPTMIWTIALCWPLLSDDPAYAQGNRSTPSDADSVQGKYLRLEAGS